ncbi:SAM-dependent methyltransferase [Streptomyces sp. NPDC004051]
MSLERPVINSSVPHSARIWNYWLGGQDHYMVRPARRPGRAVIIAGSRRPRSSEGTGTVPAEHPRRRSRPGRAVSASNRPIATGPAQPQTEPTPSQAGPPGPQG